MVGRTAKLGEDVIDFVKVVPRGPVTTSLIDQIVRSATSVGANYMEADGAGTQRDFRFKVSLCRKEAKETCHWLRMIVKAEHQTQDEARKLYQEAHELAKIFSSIINKIK